MEKENTNYHIPVLLNESVSNVINNRGGVYIDCTMGGGGHSIAILQQLSSTGKVIALDRDEDAIKFVSTNYQKWINSGQLIIVKNNFQNILEVLKSINILKVNGLLADLGISSFQIESEKRGFSYLQSSDLDMRMDSSEFLTAKEILNIYNEESLASLFYKYGEEPASKKIAHEIVTFRKIKPIEKTSELVSIIKKFSVGKNVIKNLSRIFQALRIEVNKELDALVKLLESVNQILLPGGRVVFISYHSLEDRIVKKFFQQETKTIERSFHKAIPDKIIEPNFKVISKKPITPTQEEIKLNKKSRSAKLRVYEKI